MRLTLSTRILLGGILFAALALCWAAEIQADPSDKYKKHPGYVDFEAMGVFGELEATVEVFLKGPLLQMAIGATGNDEPGIAEALKNIIYVHVQVFEDKIGPEVGAKTKELAKQLDAKGWEVVVRVRERDQQVYVYMLPSKDEELVRGLVVMVVEDEDEAVFVNIVGDMDPREIGRISGAFGHHGLDDFNIHFDDDDENDDDAEP